MLLLKTKSYQSNHHSCTRKPERKRRNPNPFSNNSKVLFFISISSFHGESWMPWRDAKFAEKKKKKREIKREDEESEDACVPQPKKREKRERRKIKRKIPTFICFNHEIRLITASRRRSQRWVQSQQLASAAPLYSGLPLRRAGLATQRCLCNRRGTNTMWETVGVAFLMIYQHGGFFFSFFKP